MFCIACIKAPWYNQLRKELIIMRVPTKEDLQSMLWWDYEEYYSVNKQNGKIELNGNAPEEVKESLDHFQGFSFCLMQFHQLA